MSLFRRAKIPLEIGRAHFSARPSADALTDVVSSLSSPKDPKRRPERKVEDIVPATPMERLQNGNADTNILASYIRSLPREPSREQIELLRTDAVAPRAVNIGLHYSALRVLVELGLQSSQTFTTLQSALVDVPVTSLQPVASVESLYTMYKASENEDKQKDWAAKIRRLIGTKIMETDMISEVSFVLSRSDEWAEECSEAVKRLIHDIPFNSLVSLFQSFSQCSKTKTSPVVNLLVRELSLDKHSLSIKQCAILASCCHELRVHDSRIMNKLAKETILSFSGLEKWNDARALIAIFSVWRTPQDEIWRMFGSWIKRRAKDAKFNDLAAIVVSMARMGRMEGFEGAKVLATKMDSERSGYAASWLNTIHALSFYKLLDHRLAESVLNPLFVTQLLEKTKGFSRMANILNLMQVNACATMELKGYNGPTLNVDSYLPENATSLAESVRYGRSPTIASFRECLSRVIADTKLVAPQLHHSGIVTEARTADGKTHIVFVGSNRMAIGEDGERMTGSDVMSLRHFEKEGLKVIVFNDRQLSAMKSAAETVAYIRKRLTDEK